MSDDNIKPSALVISADSAVVEAIIGNNTTDQQFTARETVGEVLSNTDLLEGNGIIIFDIDSAGGGVDAAIDQAIKLKQADPTQVLIMVGEKEPLSEILKSNIQPLVYRAFNKPVSPNQIFLAFKSGYALNAELVAKQAAGEDIMTVGPAENKASIDSMAASRKTNPAIYAGIGVVVLGIIAFLFLGGEDEAVAPVVVNTPQEQTTSATEDEVSTVSITNELNQQAANALLDGRYISPKGDNALEYYDQVLAIDPYDPIAYEGRKTIAESLRTSYQEYVDSADFDKALETVEALRVIEPLNLDNDTLVENLDQAIQAHVKDVQANGSAEDIAKTTAVLERIGDDKAGGGAAAALKAEQELIAKIDAALESGNLTPPSKGNAYSLVSEALKTNKISKTNSEPRVKALSASLLARANEAFEADNAEDTSKYSALVKRLNVDRKGLNELTEKVKAKQAEIAAAAADAAEGEQQAAAAVEEAKPEPPKIIPAKIISREAPRYPSRALKNEIEGWVKVRFFIDTNGKPIDVTVVESEPAKTFDDAAVKSVKKWRFSPARNQTTGLAVRSTSISTKVQFRLD